MSFARIQFERKQVNRVLVRCKNSKHKSVKSRSEKRDRRRLSETSE